MHRKPLWGSALAAIAVASLSVVNSLAEDKFRIANVGTLPGGSVSYSFAINDSGQVAGHSGITGAISHAFRRDTVGVSPMMDLGVIGNDLFSAGNGINNAGHVAGYSFIPNSPRAAYYNGTQIIDMGLLPGGGYSIAQNINDSDIIAGFGSTDSASSHGFIWQNGQFTDLGTLPGGNWSEAYDINNSGQVVGRSGTSNRNRGFITQGSNHTLVPIEPSGSFLDTEAYSVNENGVVAGTMYNGSVRQAFIFDGTQTIALGVLSGTNATSNVDSGDCINDLNMVVGTSGLPGNYRAFLYAGGSMRDLNELQTSTNWHLDDAHGINNFGQVVGKGVLSGVGERAYVATPELHWQPTSGGSWSTPANWSWGINPGAPHPVYIDSATSNAIIVDGPTIGPTVSELNIGTSGNGPAELRLQHTGTLTLQPGLGGSGVLTVGGKGVLSGAGDIQGTVVVQPGGRLAPGASSGHFNIAGSLTLQSSVSDAANLDLDLDGNPQTSIVSFDLITVTGSGNSFSAGGANLNITPHQAVVLNQPYIIVRATNNATIDSTRFGNLTNNGTTFINGIMTYTVSYTQTEISVTFSSLHLESVPEPASLMGISVLALAMRRRRR